MPAILDALTARCGSREDADQGGSRTPDAGTGPEIHTLRATAGPGTAPGSFGPWDTAQPRRRSWAPWRAAPADGRAPPREAAAPRTPAPARRSTRCGPRWALAPPPAAPSPGSRPSPPGDPGRPGGPHQLAGGHRPGRQPHHGRRHRPGDPHAAGHGGPRHRPRQLRALGHGPTSPAILDALAGRTSRREDTDQGGSRTTDAGTGPEIHTLRLTVGPGTASGSSGPWNTARPRRRSWAPWRPAPAGRRAPPRATAAPRTPAPARRSTRCGPRRATAPPPAAPCPGPRPALPAVLDALAARCGSRKDTGQGSSRALDAATGPEIYTLQATAGPWHRLRRLWTLGHGQPSPEILDALAARTSRREDASQGSSRATDAGTGPEIHALRATVGPGTAPGRFGPWDTAQPRRRSWTPWRALRANGGPLPSPRQLWALEHGPTSPAILDALAGRTSRREGTAQGSSRALDAGTGPEIHTLRLTADPGTASGSSGPWNTARPRRRSWTPWRPAAAHGRTPPREAAAPWTPAPARRSTRCGPRRALAPPPAAPGPGHVHPLPAILDALAARWGSRKDTGQGGSRATDAGNGPEIYTLRATPGPWHRLRRLRALEHGQTPPEILGPLAGSTSRREDAGQGDSRTPDAATGPEIHALRATVGPGTASGSSGPGNTASPFRRSWAPDRQHPPAGGHRPGRQPHPGRRHRRGDLHAAAHGGPWHRLRRLRAPDYGQTSPEILDALAGRTSRREDAVQGSSRAPDAGTGAEIYTLRLTVGPGTASGGSGPGLRPYLAGDPGRPGGPLRLAGGHHSGGSRALDAGTGPEIHMLRATVGPGTASVSSGPWDTARPRRRSWTPWRPATACGRTPLRGQPRPGHRHRPGDLRAAATVGPGTASGGSGPWDMAQPRRRSWAPWRAAPAGGRTQASTRTPPRETAAPCQSLTHKIPL